MLVSIESGHSLFFLFLCLPYLCIFLSFFIYFIYLNCTIKSHLNFFLDNLKESVHSLFFLFLSPLLFHFLVFLFIYYYFFKISIAPSSHILFFGQWVFGRGWLTMSPAVQEYYEAPVIRSNPINIWVQSYLSVVAAYRPYKVPKPYCHIVWQPEGPQASIN